MIRLDDTSNRVGVYGWSGNTGGVHRHRIGEPLRVLAELGVHAETGDQLDDAVLERVDTVLAHAINDERCSEAWQMLAKVGAHRLVLDVDDWVWAPDWAPMRAGWTSDHVDRLFRNVEVAHVVTTPSEVIADYLARYNRNVHVVPNTVPAYTLTLERGSDRPTLGQQTSLSHQRDWTSSVQRHIARFLNTFPTWHLNLYGDIGNDDPDAFGGRLHHMPWQSDERAYYTALAVCDAGIGPLRDTPFNRAKSSLRAVEYAALGIIAILPDLPPYRGWVIDGITGILIKPHQTLYGALCALAGAEQDTRDAMSAAARKRAAAWTTEAAIRKWVTAWESQ